MNELSVVKRSSQSWKQVDATWGEYVTAERVAETYGFSVNPRRAAQAARAYCLSCIELGGGWLMHCSFSKQTLYLFVKTGYRHEHERAWLRCQQEKEQAKRPQVYVTLEATAEDNRGTTEAHADHRADKAQQS